MAALDPQVAAICATMGAALMMVFAGVGKSMLEWRFQRRRCPACGRELRDRTCSCAA
jgi:hypothetical protein